MWGEKGTGNVPVPFFVLIDRDMEKIETFRHKTVGNSRAFSEDDIQKRKFLNSAAWRKLRKLYLQRNPICECDDVNSERRSIEVHLSIDRAEGPDLSLKWDNLQAMTKSCHSKITRERLNGR